MVRTRLGQCFRIDVIRPETLTAHEIPANRLNYLRMLTAVSQLELDVREIENLVKGEASLWLSGYNTAVHRHSSCAQDLATIRQETV